jgi:hypothetical protein
LAQIPTGIQNTNKGRISVLTDRFIRNIAAGPKPKKVTDGAGLHLLVTPQGSKLWRVAYRFDGKQKTLALGVFPTVSLAEARQRRDEAKKLLAKGTDPGEHAKIPPSA